MKNLLAKAKDLLEKAKALVAKGIAWFCGLDQKMKIIVISSAVVVVLAIVVLGVVAALPGNEQPTVPPTTGPVSLQTTYQVSVKDASGKPYTAGVIVKFMQNGKQVAMQPVNGNGIAEKNLPSGEYTVELEFTNAANAASYDQKNAVVSADAPRLDLVLMNTISGETVPLYATSPVTGEGREYLAYYVSTGDTSVPLEKGERSFFLFAPKKAGTYRFSTSGANAVVGYYGAPHFVQAQNVGEVVNNAIEISVTQSMIGTSDTGTATLVIGIDSVGDTAACVLTIERIGDPAWDISQEAWTEYKNVFTPVPFVMGEDASIKEFDLTASSDTYNLVLNEADGCYHLDSEDGPLVLIRLAEKSAYMESYKKMLETTGINCYFFDADGKFLKKEDYSGNILAYLECVDEASGLYPLTEDLKYILQNNGEYQGWWNEDGYYIFVDADDNKVPGINKDIAWLFMCCYDENSTGSFVADTTVPETTEPEDGQPETTVPEITEPETTAPATTVPPVVTKPAETRPAATQPAETQPVETKPAATRPVATRPAATRPAATVPPTTVPPTTAAPTTVPPTTAAPTTVPPTTAAPTEPKPMLGELINEGEPKMIGSQLEYQITGIAPGTRVAYDIMKLSDAYVVIYDPDAYIVYNGEAYFPENGKVSVFVTAKDMWNPVQIHIGNAGTETKDFVLKVEFPAGSNMNPHALAMGSNTTQIAKGSEKGVFYTWTAEVAGKLTVTLVDFTGGDGAGISVTVTRDGIPYQYNISTEDGVLTAEVELLSGDVVVIVVASVSTSFKRPAATIYWEIAFE